MLQKIQYLSTLVRGEALRQFDMLSADFEIMTKQKKFLTTVVEQGHFEFWQVRIVWRRISMQFNFNKIIFLLIIVLTFYQGGRWWLHVQMY